MIGQEVCVAQPPPHQHQLRMYVCVLFNMIRAVVIEVYFPDLHLLGAGVTNANYNPPASIFSFSAPTFSTQMDAQEAAEAGVGSWSGISRNSVDAEWQETQQKCSLAFIMWLSAALIPPNSCVFGVLRLF